MWVQDAAGQWQWQGSGPPLGSPPDYVPQSVPEPGNISGAGSTTIVAPPQPVAPGAPDPAFSQGLVRAQQEQAANAQATRTAAIATANSPASRIQYNASGDPVEVRPESALTEDLNGAWYVPGFGLRTLDPSPTAPPRSGAGAGPQNSVQVTEAGAHDPGDEATMFAMRERAAQLTEADGFLQGIQEQELANAIDSFIPELAAQTNAFEDEAAQHRREVRGEMQTLNGAIRALERAKIDPNRFYSSNAGMTGVSAAINIGLGAMVSVLAPGTPNYAMQIVESAIDRDIQAQLANMDNQRAGVGARLSFLQHQEQVWGNRQDALLATRAMYLDDAARRIQVLSTRHGAADAVSHGLMLANEMRIKSNEAKIQLAQSRITTRFTNTGSVPANERFAARRQGVVSAFEQAAREMEGRMTGGVSGAPQGQPSGLPVEAPNSPAVASGAPSPGSPTSATAAAPTGRRRATVARPQPAQAAATPTSTGQATAPPGLEGVRPDVIASLANIGGGRFVLNRAGVQPNDQEMQQIRAAFAAGGHPEADSLIVAVNRATNEVVVMPQRHLGPVLPQDSLERVDQSQTATQPIRLRVGSYQLVGRGLRATNSELREPLKEIALYDRLYGQVQTLRQLIQNNSLDSLTGENAGRRRAITDHLIAMRSVVTGQGGMTGPERDSALATMPDPSAFFTSDSYNAGFLDELDNIFESALLAPNSHLVRWEPYEHVSRQQPAQEQPTRTFQSEPERPAPTHGGPPTNTPRGGTRLNPAPSQAGWTKPEGE